MTNVFSPRSPRLRRSMSPRPPGIPELSVTRPSLLDPRFRCDVYVANEADGYVTLRLGDYALARIAAMDLDVPSLTQILDRLWQRRPRGYF
jgi:hypothetical protein